MPETSTTIMILVILFMSISVHEFFHAYLADAAGDPTPGIYGRVTMVPWNHWDPIGSICMVVTVISGFGLGWGKPVPMDPRKMKNPLRDHFWAVAGGPLSNLAIALFGTIIFRATMIMGPPPLFLFEFLYWLVAINCGLFIFNLLPIGPLDGMWLLGTFLPEKTRYYWTKFNLSYGQFIFLALIFIRTEDGSLIASVMGPIRRELINRLLGIRL